ncbi:iron-sulfur binding protein [Rhodopirellula islandica]|uniref:Iron-sulfur binding protein n=1 Tax=Rhodopirellula islandica TaxID=595434 RepID=A0A0J1BIJ6_RHOIS|nr:FAD-binding oxidoreductase [Rhodopirellula islandica]KLU06372.1 iron-sulfur binding protein [Rhodopirellula islandica]
MSPSLFFAAIFCGSCFLLFVGSADAIEEWEWKRLTRKRLPKLRSGNRLQTVANESAEQARTVAKPDVSQHPLRWKGWRSVSVQSIKDESPDCRSFVFVPSEGEPFPPFLGGQYLTVRLNDPSTGKKVSRCYSLSSGPDEPHYRITVKRVPGGKMSNLLHDTIGVGDQIEIQVSKGKFHSSLAESLSRDPQPLNLIAAGIGITPMLSMMFQSLNERSDREVNLFYQVRNGIDAPFLTPIREIATMLETTTGVRVHLWFSKPESDDIQPGDAVGRLSADLIVDRLGHHRGEYLICGPDVFMNAIADGLIERGAAADQVMFESFGGKSKSAGALAVPACDPCADGAGADGPESDESVGWSVTFQTSKKSASFEAGMDGLLDVAESLDVEVDSGCRSGDCGACVCRLVSGQVKYDESPECDLEDDEVVLCVAKPVSEVVIDA